MFAVRVSGRVRCGTREVLVVGGTARLCERWMSGKERDGQVPRVIREGIEFMKKASY